MSTFDKFVQMFLAIFIFLAVMGVVLFIADRVRSRKGEVVQTTVFVLPVVVMVAFGLLYPAIRIHHMGGSRQVKVIPPDTSRAYAADATATTSHRLPRDSATRPCNPGRCWLRSR